MWHGKPDLIVVCGTHSLNTAKSTMDKGDSCDRYVKSGRGRSTVINMRSES